MRVINVYINVISNDVIYYTLVRKYVCSNGDLANYSKFTLRFSSLTRALRYFDQMVLMLNDEDYHVSLNVVKVS